MIMIGSCGITSCRCCNSLRPSMPGMRTSLRIASGCSSSSLANSGCAESKTSVSKPADVSALSRTQRIERSSSTIQTLAACVMTQLQWYKQVKAGMPRLRNKFDQSLVLIHDRLGNGQTQPRSLRPTAHHGVKNGIGNVVGNARPVIDDLQRAHQPVPFGAQGNLAQGTGSQGDLRRGGIRLFHRLHGVADNVQDRLYQLSSGTVKFGNAGIIVTDDADPVTGFRLHQAAHMFKNGMDVYTLDHRQFVRAEQTINQVTQTIRLFDDDLGIFVQLLAIQLPIQQLCSAAYAPQRVLDLVGQSAYQHPCTGMARQQLFFPLDPHQSVTRLYLQQDAAIRNRVDAVVDSQLLSGLGHQTRLALAVGMAAAQGLTQYRQLLLTGRKPFFNRSILEATRTGLQQHFGGRIHVLNAKQLIQHQYRAGQVIQYLLVRL